MQRGRSLREQIQIQKLMLVSPEAEARVMFPDLGEKLVRGEGEARNAVSVLRFGQIVRVRLLQSDEPTHEVVDEDHRHSDVRVDGADVGIACGQTEPRRLVVMVGVAIVMVGAVVADYYHQRWYN